MKPKETRYIPAKKDGKFECHVHEVKEGFFWHTARALIKSSIARLRAPKPEVVDWYAPEVPVMRSQELVVTWIGHATVLIQVAGLNIVTDPIFGNSSILYPRIIKPGIALDTLPPIDLVLISHNHMDHMEGSSICALAKNHPGIKFFVPQGNKPWFNKRRVPSVTECMWWESHTIFQKLTCTFLPAVHWTQRGLLDRNRSLWGSWMIECNGKTIYFGGDTAYGAHFETIAKDFSSIDLAILPIGPCEPRDSMRHAHIDSSEAIEAFKDLGAQHFFPIHWGTFHFGHEPARLPIDRLKQSWSQTNLKPVAVLHIPKAGKKLVIHDEKMGCPSFE